jgi:prepilin-type processing-associated H-X9-DG protein
VFARARAKAQQSNCLSNVKQIELGFTMYCGDYDGRFPPQTNGPGVDWLFGVLPYVKNNQVFVCPSNGQSFVWQPDHTTLLSYGMNLNIWPVITYSAISQESITYPSEMFITADSASYSVEYDSAPDAVTPVARTFCPVHNDGFNLSYADGHCKWMARATQMTKYPSEYDSGNWNWVASSDDKHFWQGGD